MSSEWPELALTDLYEISSGLSKPADDFGSGYPFLSFTEVFRNYFVPAKLSQLVESSEKERLTGSIMRGDVFLTRTSETMHELGMSCVALKDYENATFNGFTKRLRPRKGIAYEVYPEYIGYYLRSPKFRQGMFAFSTMSTRASLNNEMIGQLKFHLPPLTVQKSIARVLKSLDDKIELNRQTNQTLEQITQAIFKSWFVGFEPVKAKMAAKQAGASAEQIEQAAICAISGKTPEQLTQLDPQTLQQLKSTAALFPDALVDSELGEIPEGWEVGKLSHVIFQRVERVTPSADTKSKPYVPIECISTNSLYLREFKSGEEANSSLTKVYKGDIIFGAMRPYFHKVCIAPFDATTRTTAFVLKPVSTSDFAFGTLRVHQKDTIDYATLHSTGSTIPYAKWDGSLSEMDIILPSMSIRERFNSIVEPIIRSIPPMIFEELNLIQLRGSLLPKLLSGEISLSNL